MNLIKKLFVYAVVFATIVTMSLPAGIAVAATNVAAGDLIKSNISSAVYYYNGSERFAFPNPTVYFSWYQDFSTVKTITAEELAAITYNGKLVTVRPGTKLVKITSDPKVYAIEPGGKLRSIPSEAVAATLYGSNWAKMVTDVSDAFWFWYDRTNTTPLSSTHPTGSLVKYANSNNVYYIDGTTKRLISAAGMTANKFDNDFVLTIPDTITYTDGTQITGAEDGLFPITSGTTATPPASTGAVSVSLAANTAQSGTIINGQAIADLGSFNFTASNDGSVKVTSLKIKRIGVSSDSVLSNIYLYDGMTKLTDSGSLSNSVVTFSNASGLFTIPAGSSKTISVKSDIAGSTGTVGISIVSASDVTTGNTVNGTFPISGNLMSMTSVNDLATLVVGTITGGGSSINAGTMNATVFSAPFTVSNKEVNLKYVSFRQVGSINKDAISNLKLFINGVQAGSASSIDDNNRVNFDLTSAPVKLNTGNTTIEVRGDIVKGSSRTFSFNVQTASDIVATDTNYGVNIAATGVNQTVAQTTINAGTISITTDPEFVTTQIVKNASNATFAKFRMKAFGEDMKINNLIVKGTFTGTIANTEGINNLAIYVNGAQVGSTQNFVQTSGILPTYNSTYAASSTLKYGFAGFGTNNLFTIPAGTTVTVEVKGTLNQLSSSSITGVATDIYLDTNKAEGVASVSTYPTSPMAGTGNALSIVEGTLTVAKNVNVQDQNVVKNTSAQKIGSYVLQTSSAEGVRITNIAIALGGSTVPATDLANLYISENTTPVQPQTTNNFPVNFTIPANTSKVIDVYADLGEIANDKTVSTTITVTGVGATTNGSVSGTKLGQTMTIKTGTISSVTSISNDPSSTMVAGGATQKAATYKFVASNGNVVITEMGVNVTTNDVATSSQAISELTVGGVTAPVVYDGTTALATFTGLSIVVPAGTQGLSLPVTAKYANVSSSGQGGIATNQLVKLKLDSFKYLVGNATTASTTVNTASNPMLLVKSVPTVTLSSSNPAAVGNGFNPGVATVMKFNVTADANSNIVLKGISVTPTVGTGVSTTIANGLRVYDSNDLNTLLGSATIGTSGTEKAITFTNEYTISAGTTKEFTVKLDATGLADDNSVRVDLTSADTFGTGTAWQWNDSTIGTYINGYLLKTLPLEGNTFTR